jgi:hypothetical protein
MLNTTRPSGRTKEIKMNEIKVFQTGRYYSEKGQRIAYVYNDDKHALYFYDVDRGIDGTITVYNYKEDSLSKEFLMYNYDRGNYMCMIDDGEIRNALRDKAMYF